MPPRRLLLLVLLSAVTTSVILFTVVSPPELPLPTYASLRGEDWLEFGSDGRCVSAFNLKPRSRLFLPNTFGWTVWQGQLSSGYWRAMWDGLLVGR